MIRFYKQWAKQLLQMLTHFQATYPGTFAESSTAMTTAGQTGEETIALLQEMLAADPIETDLIDGLVRILSFPHLENRVSRGMLTKLRRALLIPSELRQVTQVMNDSWFCDNCRTPFDEGDLLTIRRVTGGPDGDTCLVLYCARCIQPDSYRCRLHHQVPVSSAFARVLRKMFDMPCDTCARETERNERESRPPSVSVTTSGVVSLSEPPRPADNLVSFFSGLGEATTISSAYVTASTVPPTSIGRSPVSDWAAFRGAPGSSSQEVRAVDRLNASLTRLRDAASGDDPYGRIHRSLAAEIASAGSTAGAVWRVDESPTPPDQLEED